MTLFTGTSAGETITGTSGDDTIRGLGGDDILFGLEGADKLFGGDGDDVVNAGDGDDVLDGGIGADTMRGGLGDDTFYVDDSGDLAIESAGEGIDLVYSAINHRLRENVENLTLTGTAVRALGNAADNRLLGNASNNILDGLAGADVMRGGLGDDSYYVDNSGDQPIENADEGTDTVFSSISYRLGSNLENLNLLGSAVRGLGNALDNRIVGTSGSNDIDGGAGADVMRGGGGNDTYYVDDLGDRVIENSGEGTDTVRVTISGYTLSAEVERGVVAVSGSTGFSLTGNRLDNQLNGNTGRDFLFGAGGDDTISGRDGDDVLHGDAGNDHLIGGNGDDQLYDSAGADVMIGGAGDDFYQVDNAGDVVTENAGEGADEVNVFLGSYTLPDNVEIASAGNAITLTGNALANFLYGSAYGDTLSGLDGNDEVQGRAGSDSISGGTGDDALYGGIGNDTISGGDGDDYINGNSGADQLTGGTGHDVFRFQMADFNEPNLFDLILDFHSSQGPTRGADDDTLDLQLIDANSLVAGDQAFNYVGTAAFTGTAGELRADVTNSSRGLSYHLYGDMDGDGVADFQVTVHVIGTALYSDDIIF